MIKLKLLFAILFLFINLTFAAETNFIQNIEGKVLLNKVVAIKGSSIKSADEITTLSTQSKFHKDLIVLKDGNIRTPKFIERKLDHTSRENIELEKPLNRPSPFSGGYRDFMALFEWTL